MPRDAVQTAGEEPSSPDAANGRPGRIARAVTLIVGAGALLVAARPLWLVAMFACGEPASPVPYCTGTTQIATGWGATENSPLWTPALLTVSGVMVGMAVFLLSRLLGRYRPMLFLVAGVLVAHVAGLVVVAAM